MPHEVTRLDLENLGDADIIQYVYGKSKTRVQVRLRESNSPRTLTLIPNVSDQLSPEDWRGYRVEFNDEADRQTKHTEFTELRTGLRLRVEYGSGKDAGSVEGRIARVTRDQVVFRNSDFPLALADVTALEVIA